MEYNIFRLLIRSQSVQLNITEIHEYFNEADEADETFPRAIWQWLHFVLRGLSYRNALTGKYYK